MRKRAHGFAPARPQRRMGCPLDKQYSLRAGLRCRCASEFDVTSDRAEPYAEHLAADHREAIAVGIRPLRGEFAEPGVEDHQAAQSANERLAEPVARQAVAEVVRVLFLALL